ncbi:MAG: IS3 family transposase [Rhodothermales bacterium]
MKRRQFTEEFKLEAVRLVEADGLSLRQASEDLGIGLSTLTRWKQIYKHNKLPPEPDTDLNKELVRLRKENDLLRAERDLLKKANSLLRQGKSMMFKLIDAGKAQIPVTRMCALLGVSSSGYYAWKKHKPSRRQLDDMIYLAYIREQFKLSNDTYGYPRMYAELVEQGFSIGKHRVARLMRDNGLKALRKHRFKRTTDSNHHYLVAPNLLNQDFRCEGPNQKWGVNISYLWTREGWLYRAIVLDLYSRRIVGWAVSDRLKKSLATTALSRAIIIRQPKPGLIHHSDRGSQYCSHEYQKLLKQNNMIPSMSGKGNCYDNAMVETVFKTIKNELVWRTPFQTRKQAEDELGKYINGFYNPKRRHSALGYKSPIKFEAEMKTKRENLSTYSG